MLRMAIDKNGGHKMNGGLVSRSQVAVSDM